MRDHAQANDPANFAARLSLLRIACRKKTPLQRLLKSFLNDPDERIQRMATREFIRRRPAEYENVLLQKPQRCLGFHSPGNRPGGGSVRVRTVLDAVRKAGQNGTKTGWAAMMKLLPDSIPGLGRKLVAGILEHRLKAMLMVQELKVADQVVESLLIVCADASPRLRSRAVALLADVPELAPDHLIERLLCDTDSRVRANAIEVLETRHKAQFVPLLIQRARMGSNRERANAIKVLHRLRMNVFGSSLQIMLNDPRPEHRISAMWALKQTGWWNLISEVGRMAKSDQDLKVRRYAVGVLKAASELIKEQRLKAAG